MQQGEAVTITGVYEEDKRVADAYRYIIQIKNGTSTIETYFQNGTGKFNDQPTTKVTHQVIVLIIESPHKDEYDSQFHPIAPAQGSTGNNIKKYICKILNKHGNLGLKDNSYDLIVCNPVQFQASLFHLHKKALGSKNRSVASIRDKAWLAMYQKEKKYFFKRLTDYNPLAIINACTSNLKAQILSDINEWNITRDTTIFVAAKHPCIWSSSTKLMKS
jgi:hypothetical protein